LLSTSKIGYLKCWFARRMNCYLFAYVSYARPRKIGKKILCGRDAKPRAVYTGFHLPTRGHPSDPRATSSVAPRIGFVGRGDSSARLNAKRRIPAARLSHRVAGLRKTRRTRRAFLCLPLAPLVTVAARTYEAGDCSSTSSSGGRQRDMLPQRLILRRSRLL
jgi:hypothetical protein